MREVVKYSFREQLLNALTHWIGFVLGITGLVVLVLFGVKNNSVTQIVSFSIYGAGMIFLYLSSAMYHSVPNEKAKTVLRVFDHCSIFIFIGATYTPIILLSLGQYKYITLAFIWSVCLFGIIFKIITTGRFNKFNKLALVIYLALGWFSVFLIKSILDTTSLKFIIFLITGGLLYSVGTIFYANKKLPYNHAIWHLFVLFASIAHYVGILETYAINI